METALYSFEHPYCNVSNDVVEKAAPHGKYPFNDSHLYCSDDEEYTNTKLESGIPPPCAEDVKQFLSASTVASTNTQVAKDSGPAVKPSQETHSTFTAASASGPVVVRKTPGIAKQKSGIGQAPSTNSNNNSVASSTAFQLNSRTLAALEQHKKQ